jgi:hypothetical protein
MLNSIANASTEKIQFPNPHLPAAKPLEWKFTRAGLPEVVSTLNLTPLARGLGYEYVTEFTPES